MFCSLSSVKGRVFRNPVGLAGSPGVAGNSAKRGFGEEKFSKSGIHAGVNGTERNKEE